MSLLGGTALRRPVVPPVRSGWRPGDLAGPLVHRNLVAARHTWPVLAGGFFEPLFYLLSLGVGLGHAVGQVTVGGVSVGYAAFVGPALLATSAMNGAVFDTTGNVFYKLTYARLYDAVLATPLGARHVVVGELSWAVLRGTVYATAFLAAMAVLGLVHGWAALLAVPSAVLIALSFGGVGLAVCTFMRSWHDHDVIQIFLVPLFLLSGTFFPIDAYPAAVREIVSATPLYQGIDLVRDVMLGHLDGGTAVHVLYLAVLGAAGLALAVRRMERRLVG